MPHPLPRQKKYPKDICKIKFVEDYTRPAWSVSNIGLPEDILLSHPISEASIDPQMCIWEIMAWGTLWIRNGVGGQWKVSKSDLYWKSRFYTVSKLQPGHWSPSDQPEWAPSIPRLSNPPPTITMKLSLARLPKFQLQLSSTTCVFLGKSFNCSWPLSLHWRKWTSDALRFHPLSRMLGFYIREWNLSCPNPP